MEETVIVDSALFLLGLVVLYFGAELLVKGAVRLATSFGVSMLVVGLTVVAFGTSLPELTVNLAAAYRGSMDLAFGDVVGSNIANVGLIMGLAAAIRSLDVHGRVIRREVPIACGATLALAVMALNAEISRLDGVVLLAGFGGFVYSMFQSARSEGPVDGTPSDSSPATSRARLVDAGMIAGGLILLISGAHLMVESAVKIARDSGISELVIGMTIVAVGTSLPEMATTVVAALRNKGDIAVGNIVGSNIFNVLLILGVTAQVRPLPVQAQSLSFDVPFMLALTFALFPIMWRGSRVSRGGGLVLLGAYVAFVVRQVYSG
jgi:cation:H+ antiporter